VRPSTDVGCLRDRCLNVMETRSLQRVDPTGDRPRRHFLQSNDVGATLGQRLHLLCDLPAPIDVPGDHVEGRGARLG
jgi:hypothetical protein